MKNGLVKKGGVASLKAVFFYFVLNNKNYLVFFFLSKLQQSCTLHMVNSVHVF